jgi:hypothetical protein
VKCSATGPAGIWGDLARVVADAERRANAIKKKTVSTRSLAETVPPTREDHSNGRPAS